MAGGGAWRSPAMAEEWEGQASLQEDMTTKVTWRGRRDSPVLVGFGRMERAQGGRDVQPPAFNHHAANSWVKDKVCQGLRAGTLRMHPQPGTDDKGTFMTCTLVGMQRHVVQTRAGTCAGACAKIGTGAART